MTAFHIKLFAILFMIIDHIGLFFFPQDLTFRIIGRLAFPLFAWLIANGAQHTHNINAYVTRIFLLALASQIPYILANRYVDPSFASLNVLFTLGLGLTAIVFIKKTQNRQLWLLIAVICGGLAHLFHTDYGVFGVLTVVSFYLFFNSMKYMFLSLLVLAFVPFLLLAEYRQGSIEPFGLASLVFIALYNKKEGIKAQYLFYVFFPLQYVALYVLKLLGR
jgi:hypothetical protein